MIKVEKGQDPYSVIGKYIRDHVSEIEDMIAVIEIDGNISNELFMVDMKEDGYFVWKSDWYEGEQNIALIDFFPVSSAEPERENETVGCNGCKYDCFGDPRCSRCARSFQDYYEADMRGSRMDDLISRQAAIDAIENTDCELTPSAWDELTDAIMQVPSAQPTADVVEVVRCNDCTHWWIGRCYLLKESIEVRDCDYCSYGERKDD